MQAKATTSTPQGSPRFTLRNMHVLVDRKSYTIVNMNIREVLIAGMPDWMAAGQRVQFSFVITLKNWERSLSTFGVVTRNDGTNVDLRYSPPLPSWRDILMKLIAEDSKTGA